MSLRERQDGPNEGPLGLNISRFDERQRRQRLVLPHAAGCWDYAPLVDLVVREPGADQFRFAGRTVAEHLALLRRRADPGVDRFIAWFERNLTPHLPALARRRRTPDNHYCIEVAPLPLVAALPQLVRSVGPNRATPEQWLSSLQALTEKGTKREELILSGVLSRLERAPQDAKLTRAQVLRMVDLSHVLPKLVCESRFGFAAKSGWRECCDRLPASDKKRRRLHGVGHGMAHVRFRHRSLGWAVARTRFSDLLVEQRDWWIVLDEKGRLIDTAKSGFASPDEAIEFAELQMAKQFLAWGKHQATVKWERFSLPGGDDYRELLIQLDDWPLTYHPRHFRTRNVLAHVRSSIRLNADGRRVLFLDEIQSDWHADLHAQARGVAADAKNGKVAEAPFAKDWPLLTVKIMVWWAQRCGADGLSWSSADLQEARWDGYGPPGLLYRKLLPDAAMALAKALPITAGSARLRVRTGTKAVCLGTRGWEVRNQNGCAVTKPFDHRGQAERFADLTGEFADVDMPALWLDGLGTITAVPLYGTGAAERWTEKAAPGSR
ncbi:hypothetical protein [Piscinibacter sp.]|uniref:hypothetical protein n=1 Tax=Piscinibacter sp. TaxID=1903157 RepID=UPI001D1E3DED|nr:hypothetical protein [Piscinibacter sp.]MBK7531571.1 hypothetical protein [Piscinibacter sp.]